MESNVVSSHLRSKFSSTLMEAAINQRISSLMLARFQLIEAHINHINHNSATMVDLLYDLMDALSECTIFDTEADSNKAFKFFRVVKFENKMRSRLDKIDKNLRDLNQQHNGTAGHVVIHKQAFPDLSVIVGFESQVGEIEELLMPMDSHEVDEEEFKSIGIVGMCGSGKTALAQQVFSSSSVEKQFFPRIWVGLSERLFVNERERILIHILREIGHDASDLEYGDYSVVQLLEKLRLRLMGKRYLIVLDDAWRMKDWFADLGCKGQPMAELFTHALPKWSGGAVIVTSRGENVVRGMVGEKHVTRPQLSDDLCWTIFSNAVRQQGKIDPHHPTLIQMKESVTDNCHGLPLAAKTLAYVISDLLTVRSHD